MGLVDVLAEDGQGEDACAITSRATRSRHGAQRGLCEVRRRINPLTFDELADITDIWVETALRLDEIDLRKMERLMAAQRRRIGTTASARRRGRRVASRSASSGWRVASGSSVFACAIRYSRCTRIASTRPSAVTVARPRDRHHAPGRRSPTAVPP